MGTGALHAPAPEESCISDRMILWRWKVQFFASLRTPADLGNVLCAVWQRISDPPKLLPRPLLLW